MYKRLEMNDFYSISEHKIYATDFFKALAEKPFDVSTLFIEGTPTSKEIRKIYNSNAEEGGYLPNTETIFPRAKKFRCKFSSKLMIELAAAAEHHAVPEYLEHLHLYNGNKPILIWTDAFCDDLLISKEIPWDVVEKFTAAIKAKA